jgi:RND family efflux transporter MFP subunit
MTHNHMTDDLMTHSRSEQAKPVKAIPALNIRGPMVIGLAAVTLFAGAALGTASQTHVETSFSIVGKVSGGGKPQAVRHPRGGTVAEAKVVEGQLVAAGDVLLTFDTTATDEQIGALMAQSEATTKQLDVLTAEVATTSNLLGRKLATVSQLKDLEAQFKAVRADAERLSSQTTQAQADLEKSVIRAPTAGRVATLTASSRGTIVLPGTTIAEIVPETGRLAITIQLSPEQAEQTSPGMAAKVVFAHSSGRSSKPITATLVWQSPDRTADKRTGETGYAAHVEIAESQAESMTDAPITASRIPQNSRADVTLLTGRQKLLAHMLNPLPALTETHR